MPTPSFFILGRPRSGTTLLRVLFDAHPNVRIPPELPVFLMLYKKYEHVRNWDRDARLSFIDHVFQPTVFNLRRIENLKIDRAAFTEALLKMEGTITITDLLMKINEHAYSMFPKAELMMVGDKNPVYSIFTRRLLKIFPESKFIFIIRDYRDNFVSLRNLKDVHMEAPVLALQVARWRRITKTFIECKEKYPDRISLIRYEYLVTDPEGCMIDLCGFLGIPYRPEVFEFYRKKDEFISTFADPRVIKIHQSLLNPITTSRIGMWKSGMTGDEIVMADQLAGDQAHLLGYTSEQRDKSLAISARALPWIIYTRILFGVMNLSARMPYTINRYLAVNVSRLARIQARISRKNGRSVQEK